MNNHYQCNFSKHQDNIWVATEKVHGFNYSFICDGVTVCPAKKGSTLSPTTGFNNHQKVFALYKNETQK